MADGFVFDGQSVRRISGVVRRVEGTPIPLSYRRRRNRPPVSNPILAKITGEGADSDHWQGVEVWANGNAKPGGKVFQPIESGGVGEILTKGWVPIVSPDNGGDHLYEVVMRQFDSSTREWFAIITPGAVYKMQVTGLGSLTTTLGAKVVWQDGSLSADDHNVILPHHLNAESWDGTTTGDGWLLTHQGFGTREATKSGEDDRTQHIEPAYALDEIIYAMQVSPGNFIDLNADARQWVWDCES